MEIPSVIKNSVPKACLKKKGDLATAKDDGQLETVSVGGDGTVLTADSSQPTGFKWVPGNGSSGSPSWGSIIGTLSSQEDLENALNGKEPANSNIQAHITVTGNPHGTTKAEIGLDNVTDEAQVPKSVGTAKGSLIGFSDSGTPVEVPVGADAKVLTADATQPSGVAWKDAPAGTAAWGSIAGTLNNQADLQTALNAKAPTTAGTSILRGNGTGGFANAAAGTDYAPATSGSSILKGSGSGGFSNAVPKTDYAPPTSGSSILKGDGSGGFNAAVSGADYLTPTGDGSQLTGITPSQVGLGNVTDDKQVKAAIASTDGNFVSWSGATGTTIVDSGKKASDFAATSHVHTPGQVGLGNVTNEAQIPKSLGTGKGSFVGFSATGVPAEVIPGTDGKVLAADSTSPTGLSWVANSAVAAWQAIASKPEITIGDSSPSGYDTLAHALDIAASGMIVVPPGTHNLVANKTLAPGVYLRVLAGAVIHIEDGVTFSVNGKILADDYQIFSRDTSGAVSYAASGTIYARWFGAKGNKVTDDAPALNWLVASIGNSVSFEIVFGSGTYIINSDVTFPKTARLVIPKGAILSPGEEAQTIALTNTWPTGTGTVEVKTGDLTKICGTGTNFSAIKTGQANPGMYIQVGSEIKQIQHSDTSRATYVQANNPFSAPIAAGSSFSYSGLKVTAAAVPDLEPGDFIYLTKAGQTYTLVAAAFGPNSSLGLADNKSFCLQYHPPVPFVTGTDSSYTRGVRLMVSGSLEVGSYQWIDNTCKGTVKFSQGVVRYVLPEWWGAISSTDGVTVAYQVANVNAFRKAVFCTHRSRPDLDPSGGTLTGAVVRLTGYYRFNSHLWFPGNTWFISDGGREAYLDWVKSADLLHGIIDCGMVSNGGAYGYQVNTAPPGFFGINAVVNTHRDNPRCHTFCGISNSKKMKWDACWFTTTQDNFMPNLSYALFLPGCCELDIRTCHFGPFFGGNEAIVRGCTINAGQDFTQTPNNAFTCPATWSWSFDDGLPFTHTRHTLVATAALSGDKAYKSTKIFGYGIAGVDTIGHRYALWYEITGMTPGGSVYATVGGVNGTTRTANGIYVDEFNFVDTPATQEVSFTAGTGGFTGTIKRIYGQSQHDVDWSRGTGGPQLVNCILPGDNTFGYSGLRLGCYNPHILGNQIQNHHCEIAIDGGMLMDGQIIGNTLSAPRKHGIYVLANAKATVIMGNSIKGAGYIAANSGAEGNAGVYGKADVSGLLITGNTCPRKGDDSIVQNIKNFDLPGSVTYGDGSGYLCYDNFGDDLGFNSSPPTLSGVDPYVNNGGHFIINNAGSTTIKSFHGGGPGKEINLTITDTNTKLVEFCQVEYLQTYKKGANTYTQKSVAVFDYFTDAGTLEVDDAIYFGGVNSIYKYPADRWCTVQINVGTRLDNALGTFVWEYFNTNSEWVTLSTSKNAHEFFGIAGIQTMYFQPPLDWLHSAIGVARTYWIRCRCTDASGTGDGGANQTNMPQISYLRIAGDFGPVPAGQVGRIQLKRHQNGLWYETGRLIR